MTPFWDPNFTPPCGQLAAPYLYANKKPSTQFQVVHTDNGPRSDLLSCEPLALPWQGEPRVRMMPVLVILASRPQMTNPWCPDAGTSEGIRLGGGLQDVRTRRA